MTVSRLLGDAFPRGSVRRWAGVSAVNVPGWANVNLYVFRSTLSGGLMRSAETRAVSPGNTGSAGGIVDTLLGSSAEAFMTPGASPMWTRPSACPISWKAVLNQVPPYGLEP